MLADLADLFSVTVFHAPAAGFNRQGEPLQGALKPYRARVVYRARMVRTAQGQTAVCRGEVWIAGTPAIGLDDAITLPDGSTPPILAAECFTDEAGPSHVHVMFG